jgi:hypothetical protein
MTLFEADVKLEKIRFQPRVYSPFGINTDFLQSVLKEARCLGRLGKVGNEDS